MIQPLDSPHPQGPGFQKGLIGPKQGPRSLDSSCEAGGHPVRSKVPGRLEEGKRMWKRMTPPPPLTTACLVVSSRVVTCPATPSVWGTLRAEKSSSSSASCYFQGQLSLALDSCCSLFLSLPASLPLTQHPAPLAWTLLQPL